MLDLVTVNYNTKDLLKRQVDCLTATDTGEYNFSMLIADNGSSDDSVDYLKDLDRPFINAIVYNTNIGFSAAVNRLASHGSNDIIGILNADVWLTSEDCKKIEDSFLNHPEMAIMGPKQRDEKGYIRHAGIEGTNTQPRHRGWGQFDPTDSLYRDFREMVTVSGSAYFIRRSVWETLTNDDEYRKIFPQAEGAFLPTPHYYEETWCSYFARHRGYKVFYDGSISIGHSWHASHAVGSEHDKKFPISQTIFRATCDRLGIERD